MKGNSWSKLLNGNTTGSTNKALFIYGLALHTVTDLFAHSTYILNEDGSYSYIDHAMRADYKDKVENRFACAEVMAQKVISHIKSFESGDISDFYAISDVYDGTFYIGKYSTHAKTIDVDYYEENSWFFDDVNIY